MLIEVDQIKITGWYYNAQFEDQNEYRNKGMSMWVVVNEATLNV